MPTNIKLIYIAVLVTLFSMRNCVEKIEIDSDDTNYKSIINDLNNSFIDNEDINEDDNKLDDPFNEDSENFKIYQNEIKDPDPEIFKDNMIVVDKSNKNEISDETKNKDTEYQNIKTEPYATPTNTIKTNEQNVIGTNALSPVNVKQIDEITSGSYVISILTHVLLALNGLYLLFYGFRIFRLSIIILGFLVGYYTILILIAHTSYYKPSNMIHEVGILFISLGIGFLILMLTFMFENANYLVLSSSVGLLTSVFYAQFFLNFSVQSDKFYMLTIYAIVSLIIIIASKLYLKPTIIFICAFIGSISLSVNVGIITGDFKSFENREKLSPNSYEDFCYYCLAAFVLFIAGISFQFFLRYQIIKDFSNRKLEELRGVSFLN